MAAVEAPSTLDLKAKLLSHPLDADVDMEATVVPAQEHDEDL